MGFANHIDVDELGIYGGIQKGIIGGSGNDTGSNIAKGNPGINGYCGGGGGGLTGGSILANSFGHSGGGNGTNVNLSTSATNGEANTGGGGGGGGGSGTVGYTRVSGANGGSGLVIIKYWTAT
jgi:hypothetical protein